MDETAPSEHALIPLSVKWEGCTWPMWRPENSEEQLLVKDLDEATWLGFDNPYNIR